MIVTATRPRPIVIMAMDKSVRSVDVDGRMHVEASHITKANICPYLGREIPGHEDLGLDPGEVYRLLRHPDELKKAAATFNNLPILKKHIPVTADNHPAELVVGSTGTDCVWNAPYLDNSLVIWTADAIDAIKSNHQRQLSSAYRYEAVMEPGTYEGLPYQGYMRNIVGNHVALVPEGRAGSDVIVGDSKLERPVMAKALKSRKALMVAGAIGAYVGPKLAQDAKVDISSALQGVTAKNYKSRKARIIATVTTLTKGKLAQDANLDDIIQLVDALDDITDGEVDADALEDVADGDPAAGGETMADEDDQLSVDADGDKIAKLMAFLEGKLSDEDMAAATELVGAASDDGDDTSDDDEAPPKDDAPAMDAKIKAAVTAERKRARAVAQAREDVRPHVGEVSLALDSAADVYRVALDNEGMDLTGIPEAAFGPLVRQLNKTRKSPALAQDGAAALTGFQARFPKAIRPRVSA